MIHTRYISAKRAGAVRYNTGKPCLRGHIADRYVTGGRCIACMYEDRLDNIESVRLSDRRRNIKRAEQRRAEERARRAWLRPENKPKQAARTKQWRQRNPASWAAVQAGHRAKLVRATPAWANKHFIKAFYERAYFETKATGTPHHVDHIYPINSKWVCGLHVEFNLCVVPASTNVAKRNFRTKDHDIIEALNI